MQKNWLVFHFKCLSYVQLNQRNLSLSSRCQLFDQFQDRMSQHAVKLDFLRRVHRQNAPNRRNPHQHNKKTIKVHWLSWCTDVDSWMFASFVPVFSISPAVRAISVQQTAVRQICKLSNWDSCRLHHVKASLYADKTEKTQQLVILNRTLGLHSLFFNFSAFVKFVKQSFEYPSSCFLTSLTLSLPQETVNICRNLTDGLF